MPVRATLNHKMKAPSCPFYDWASLYDWINKPWKLHDDVWKSCKFLNSFAVHSRSKLHFILTSFWLIVKIFFAFIFQQTMSLNDSPASSGFSLAWLLAFRDCAIIIRRGGCKTRGGALHKIAAKIGGAQKGALSFVRNVNKIKRKKRFSIKGITIDCNKYQYEQLLNDHWKYSIKMKSKFTTDQF